MKARKATPKPTVAAAVAPEACVVPGGGEPGLPGALVAPGAVTPEAPAGAVPEGLAAPPAGIATLALPTGTDSTC